MRWNDIGDVTCSVARTLSVIGDRWTLLILRDAFLGVRRFDDFHASLGTTRHRLADRLKKLVASGVLRHEPYRDDRRTRYEYRLTDKGHDLYPIVVSLTRWGDRWMTDARGKPLELVHRDCGQVIEPMLTCPGCHGPLHSRNMMAQAGPAVLVGGRAPARPGRRKPESPKLIGPRSQSS